MLQIALHPADEQINRQDVLVGGGVSTIRQYLQAGLVDEMHIAVSPVLLGAGEHLLGDLNLPALGYERAEYVGTPKAGAFRSEEEVLGVAA